MTTGPILANNIGLYIDGTLVACMQSLSFSSKRTSIKVKCKDYTGSLGGSLEWGMGGSGALRFDAAYGAIDLLTAHKNNSTVTAKWSTEATGDKRIVGDVIVLECELGADVDKEATYSVTLEGQGDYEIETVS